MLTTANAARNLTEFLGASARTNYRATKIDF